MKIAFFSAKSYDKEYFNRANTGSGIEFDYFESSLNPKTAKLLKDYDAVCAFVNDDLGRETLSELSQNGIRLVALRCAGFNHVDLHAAEGSGIRVMRVPAYSPHAVAEHAPDGFTLVELGEAMVRGWSTRLRIWALQDYQARPPVDGVGDDEAATEQATSSLLTEAAEK